MDLNRRELMTAAVVAGVAGVTRGVRAADEPAAKAAGNEAVIPAPKRKAVLKISSQEGVLPGKTLKEKLDIAEKWGVEGFEPGGGGLPGRVKELQDALQGRSVKISAICGGFKGCLISEKSEQRELAMKTIKEIVSAAGELGSTGMIFVPSFHGQTEMRDQDARKILIEELKELGEHAHKAGTRIILEPLNRRECYFLRLVADAAAMCRDVNSPGVGLMGDFWHMTWEETSDLGAFLSGGDYVHHVHMASRKRRVTPTEDGEADNYVLGFKGLKYIGYQDYVSFECGTKGDKMTVLPAAIKLLREQWEQA